MLLNERHTRGEQTMKAPRRGRRHFLKGLGGMAAIVPAVGPDEFIRELTGRRPRLDAARQGAPAAAKPGRIKFAVIGLNHSHIIGQATATIRGGGELVSV